MVTCHDCEDYDLCVNCLLENSHGHHPGHSFSLVQDRQFTLRRSVMSRCHPGRNQYHAAVCDGCDKVSCSYKRQYMSLSTELTCYSKSQVYVTSAWAVLTGITARIVFRLHLSHIPAIDLLRSMAPSLSPFFLQKCTLAFSAMVLFAKTKFPLASLGLGTSALCAMTRTSALNAKPYQPTRTTTLIPCSSSRHLFAM